MQNTVELQTDGFFAMIHELAALSGRDFGNVLLHQVGALLRVCIRRTRSATRGGIIKRASKKMNHIEFYTGEVISFWKKADAMMFLDKSNFKPRPGQKQPKLIGGKSWHQVEGLGFGDGDRRWSAERWARFKAFDRLAEAHRKKNDPKEALKSRGLSKQSWLQIADDLGIDIGAPAYVRNARPSNGRYYKNGRGTRLLEDAAMYIELINDHPLVVDKLGGAQILQAAINTRMKAFKIDMEKGVFSDVLTRARRYPGIFTTS
jgi:hypothetical protein